MKLYHLGVFSFTPFDFATLLETMDLVASENETEEIPSKKERPCRSFHVVR